MAGYRAIRVPQKDGYNSLANRNSDIALIKCLQTIYIVFASLTCTLASLTVCSAMFLNLVSLVRYVDVLQAQEQFGHSQ
jgi:hypothetical protein